MGVNLVPLNLFQKALSKFSPPLIGREIGREMKFIGDWYKTANVEGNLQ
jgi:hypothetical protein